MPPLAEPEAVELFCARSQLASERGDRRALPAARQPAARRRAGGCPHERALSRSRSSSGSRSGSICSRVAATPRPASRRCGRRSSGRYDLLSPEEQQLFARLSVFAGGCTLEAAEEVCGADVDTLQSLVEKSMLRPTDERYWMLETIREFADERLEESGDADGLRRLHAAFFLDLAQSLGLTYESIEIHGAQRHDIAVLEQGNLRAALDWAAEQDLRSRLTLAVVARGLLGRAKPARGCAALRSRCSSARQTMPVGLRAGCWRCLAGSTQFGWADRGQHRARTRRASLSIGEPATSEESRSWH